MNLNENRFLIFKDIKVNIELAQVFIHGKEIGLTKKEFDLLVFFITNKNKVVSKYAIVAHLWENFQDPEGSYDFLYAQIKNLRKKILAAGGTDYIQNVNRIGYRFM
jgi:DNA-binding response OmpR family regulator